MLADILQRVTYHAVYDGSIIDALHYARDNGFAGVQVAVETPHVSPEALSREERAEVREFVRANGIMLSMHGPDEVASLVVSDPHLSEGIFGYWSALFEFAEEVGAGLITFHLGSIPSFGTDTVPRVLTPEVDVEHYRRTIANNLDRLIGLADGRFTLCVENYKIDASVLDILKPRVKDCTLALCWDLAKTYRSDRTIDAQLESYFRENARFVKQVHLHDIREHSHAVIGTGCVDFPRFLDALADADVREYCIEVRPREKAKESLDSLRAMLES
jgi:sugar phosphate isomerase/epimerase